MGADGGPRREAADAVPAWEEAADAYRRAEEAAYSSWLNRWRGLRD
ncbi:hypothetical protein AB0J35_61965 [Nonomuraea angiospora]